MNKKIDVKRISIVIIFSLLMILWLFKAPIKSYFKAKKKKKTTTFWNIKEQKAKHFDRFQTV